MISDCIFMKEYYRLAPQCFARWLAVFFFRRWDYYYTGGVEYQSVRFIFVTCSYNLHCGILLYYHELFIMLDRDYGSHIMLIIPNHIVPLRFTKGVVMRPSNHQAHIPPQVCYHENSSLATFQYSYICSSASVLIFVDCNLANDEKHAAEFQGGKTFNSNFSEFTFTHL